VAKGNFRHGQEARLDSPSKDAFIAVESSFWLDEAFTRFFCIRPQGTAIIPGLFRRAKSPKWQDVFTPDDRSFFHAEAGDVLVKLGYAKSEKWINE